MPSVRRPDFQQLQKDQTKPMCIFFSQITHSLAFGTDGESALSDVLFDSFPGAFYLRCEANIGERNEVQVCMMCHTKLSNILNNL